MVKDELNDYGLEVRESDNPDRVKIDFTLEDYIDNVAWVWGNTIEDVEVECNHPVEPEFDDDETVGECPICGATCDWHWNTFGDGDMVQRERAVDRWYPADKPGGLIEKYIKENYGSK